MKVAIAIGLILIPISVDAALSNFWVTAGGYKQPREDVLPYVNCSTCVISRNWNGTTASFFSGKNEAIGFALYMGNSTGSSIADISVAISSFTGPSGYAIISTATLITGVTNYANPIEVFYVRYLPIVGMTQLSWDGTEFEMRDVPERMRRPCTVNGNNDCVPTGGALWTSRQDHDKAYPEILIPYEAVAASSFTVNASSSQAIWFDIWVSSLMSAGTYTGTITVKEGVVVSTRIPVSLEVRNFKLPDVASLKAITYVTPYNISYRHHGEHFPPVGCTSCTVTEQNYAKSLHRHKLSAIIGENCCGSCASTTPCPKFVSRMNGSLYTPTSGYITGPGVGVGDQIFSIGTYSTWDSASWSTSTVTGASGFCTNVEAWSTYMASNFSSVKSFLYLQDEPASLADVNKWSTWMSTACSMPTYKINSMFTGSWVDASVSATKLNLPVATTFIRASSATWQTVSNTYQTVGTTQAWIYNSHPPHTGSVYAIEDDGIAPVTIFWSMFKKRVPTWFGWSSDYWTDSNNGGQPPGSSNDNDIFNEAKTFGYDLWENVTPSSSSVKGRTGFGYSNGDGVLLYPGHDQSPNATNDYGFDGPIASWRLKMLRRGIQDGDYMTLAYAADPVATDALVTTMVPDVLWERECFDPMDCTFAYGGRSWSNDASLWEEAREDLADIIDAEEAVPAIRSTGFRGKTRFKGKLTIK